MPPSPTISDVLEEWPLKSSQKLARWFALALLATVWFFAGCTQPAEFVDDRGNFLSAAETDRITRICRKLLEDLDIHILTVVLDKPSGDINAEAVAVFKKARLGESSVSARGLLFLVDPDGSQVRLEVGYDLEGIYTDMFVDYIERDKMMPFFQAGRVGHGIEATVELLAVKAMKNRRFFENTDGRSTQGASEHLSGGARIDATIGSWLPHLAAAN